MTPSREELLQSIRPDMKLTKAFFLRIYGYEISYPGFAAVALEKLEAAGCSKARVYYDSFVSETEERYEKGMREAAGWHVKEMKKKGGKEAVAGDRKTRYQFTGFPENW